MKFNPLCLAFFALPAVAGEYLVEPASFQVEKSFSALVIPGEPVLFQLAPESWQVFEIEQLVDQGSKVKKGEVVIRFKREGYDRHVEDATRALEGRKLEVTQKRAGVEALAADTELKLAAARRASAEAADDLAYFKDTTLPARKKNEARRVEAARFQLLSSREELRQLKAMYEADDLVEDTEEIIMKRQQFEIDGAELVLANVERDSARVLSPGLDRELKAQEDAAATAATALAKAEKSWPAALEAARLELAGLETALQREEMECERLKKDGALFEWRAPSDGLIFYGALEPGAWSPGELVKSLVPGGKVPLRQTLLSLATEGAPATSAWVDAATAFQVKPAAIVRAELIGMEDLSLTGTVSAVSTTPSVQGKYRVELKIDWPEKFKPAPASWLTCTVVTRHVPEALAIPDKALRSEAGAWAVEVKMSDGKTGRRKVSRGLSNGQKTEILGGLEPGQVVIVPD